MYQNIRKRKPGPLCKAGLKAVGSLKNRKHHKKSGIQRMYRNIRSPPFANGCNETA